MPPTKDPFLTIGVMSTPSHNTIFREQWRIWRRLFNDTDARVQFIFGDSTYDKGVAGLGDQRFSGAKVADDATLSSESRRFGDLKFIHAREALPHVGKVTEKSAEFWRTAPLDSTSKWFCKMDDDTLAHVDRLVSVLKMVEQKFPDRAVYFGHMKWRGWDVDSRFQACGGTWGDARKTMKDILEGGEIQTLDGPQRYPACPHSAGPFPYMSGGMACMSRGLAATMGASPHFKRFFSVAQERNTHGIKCTKPKECASQPAETHMWHHEDAGIGYNVFRAAFGLEKNTSIVYVPVTGHYNDPGIIERSDPLTAQDEYWSTRSLFVHGVKFARQYLIAKRNWHISWPTANVQLECHSCHERPAGVNKHYGHWEAARIPCLRQVGSDVYDGSEAKTPDDTGRFCPVNTSELFTCCNWPWKIPSTMSVEAAKRRKAAREANRAKRAGKYGKLEKYVNAVGRRKRQKAMEEVKSGNFMG